VRGKKVQRSKPKVAPVALRTVLPRGAKKPTALVAPLLKWFSENARSLPWRGTREPYAVWVSEIMLQQTQVKTVIPYYERWMRELPDVHALAAAPSEKIHKLWEGLGYYTRVRNMQKAAQAVVAQHGGIFPRNFDDVLALSGIGRYTAGAVCSIAFNQPTPILDGNVIRVLARVFGIRENAREKETNARLWTLAKDLVRAAAVCRQLGAPISKSARPTI
jgi:A/G-specific adenine glycosylase